MTFRKRIFASLILPCLLLAGCGSSSDSGSGFDFNGTVDSGGSGGSGGGSGGSGPTSRSNVSYVPLMVYEAFDSYSDLGRNDVFTKESFSPYIETIVINPINATTLESISDAVVSDYKVTVDEVEISEVENFPVLQKVLGSPTYLQTALVFDISGSMYLADINALVAEAKAYVAAAQASSNPTIANQEFAVWAFGQRINELTTGFTANTATIEAALDAVAVAYNAVSLGATTNLHRAIVQAIGRYTEGTTYEFDNDGTNDLVDRVTRDFTNLSQMVLFSSGGDTYLEMTQEEMVDAIQSQSFVSYDQASSAADGSVNLYKPVFYYVVGGAAAGDTYAPLSEQAEVTTQLVLSSGAYSFSAGLVQDQIDAIGRRIDIGNKYVYTYAFAPRIGSHTGVFSSRSENFNFTLTQEYPESSFAGDGSPGTPAEELPSLVEITGPNGEYLASGTASLAEVSTFAPATRWVNTSYGAGSYAWTSTNLNGFANADGTFTVTAITGGPATLTLQNTARGEFATILVVN